jgi:GGDEF domain-containing protein
MDDQNPVGHLTPRSTFLDTTISGSIQTGPSALAVFDYPHDSWKEAADVGGHAGSDAAVAEVIARLQATLPPTCALAALGYRTFATMIPGPRFSDHRKLVVEAVKHVNAQPIAWRGVTLAAPRVAAAVVMSPAPVTITAVGLVYEAASLVFGTAAAVLPDRVVARIYRDGDWQPFLQGRDI